MLAARPGQALLALAGHLGARLGDLPLDLAAQRVRLQPRLLAQSCGVVLRLYAERRTLAASGLEQRGGLGLGPGDLARDLVLQPRPHLADLAQPAAPQLAAVPLGLLAQLRGVAAGLLTDALALQRRCGGEVVRLLLGQSQDLVRATAEPGVVHVLGIGLAELALLELVLQAGDLALQLGGVAARLHDARLERAYVVVDGLPVVAAQRPGEVPRGARGVLEQTETSVLRTGHVTFLPVSRGSAPGDPVPRRVRVTGVVARPTVGTGRLHQLDQDAAGVLRVDEVDPRATRARVRGIIEQTQAAGLENAAGRLDVGDPVRELLQPRPRAVQEPGDRRRVAERGQQLDLRRSGGGIRRREHRLHHALALVRLAVHEDEAEHLGVEADRRVEIGHRDADVVERQHPRQGQPGAVVRRCAARLAVVHVPTVGPCEDGPVVTALDPAALLAGVRAGRPRAVGRLISLVESSSALVPDLVAALAPDTGRALVVGLTGAPGVGKSSAVGALVAQLRRRGERVGVLAVDPTSPFTGGAVLGDRVRMQEHALDTGVHIRSMATRGELGGLAAAVPAALRVLDAAGCGTTLVETVGVGQSEVAVAATADVTLVLLAPGAGDSVQLAKAGVLEVADVLVVTKADRDGASALARELRAMVAHGQRDPGAWSPPVVLLSSLDGTGVDDVLEAVAAFAAHQRATGGWEARRARRARGEVEQLVLAAVRANAPGGAGKLDRLAAEVASGHLDPYAAARELLSAP